MDDLIRYFLLIFTEVRPLLVEVNFRKDKCCGLVLRIFLCFECPLGIFQDERPAQVLCDYCAGEFDSVAPV